MRITTSLNRLRFQLCFLTLAATTLTACQIKQAPKTPSLYQSPKTMSYNDTLSQIIANAPDSIEATEAHYRLGLIKMAEHRQNEALGHFISASRQPDHFPWNIASEIEITGMNMSSDPSIFETLSAKKALLEKNADILDFYVHRADFHLVGWYFADENWKAVIDTLRTVPEISLNSDEIVSCNIFKGISLSRLGHYQDALNFLYKALDTDFSERYLALIEAMDILNREGKVEKAIELALQHSSLLNQKSVGDKFMEVLDCYADIEDLEKLASQQTSGPGAFFINLKYIDRLAEFEDPVITLGRADELGYSYPDYSDFLTPVKRQLTNAIHANPEKIGLLLPLSGQVASIGHSIYRGAQLALSDYQQNGGRFSFSFSLQDTGETRNSAVDAFIKLVEHENVIAIVGPVRSAVTEMLLPWCTAYRTPLVTPGSSQENLVQKSRWAFRLFPSISYEMQELIQFSVRELGLYRFGCLYPDTDYGEEACAVMEDVIQSEQAELVFKRQYSRDPATIGTRIGTLSDSTTDIIVIPDLAERAAIVAGHIRYKEAFTPTIAGISAWEKPELMDIAGQHLEGSFFVSSYPVSAGVRKEISDRYYAKFGEQADSFALRGYEAVFLIISSVEKGIRYRSQLRALLAAEGGLMGVDGPSRFSESGEYEPPVTVFRIHDSKYTPWRLIPIHFNESTLVEDTIQNQIPWNPNPGQ